MEVVKMINEIVTDVGNFDNFVDIYLYMRDMYIEQIYIKSIKLWDGAKINLGLKLGVYTFWEIKTIAGR
jgi:hypothetical protein